MPRINPDRLIADLRTFATFGAYRTGVHRPTYSEQDIASRNWLADQYRATGLEAEIDGIGNVFGRAAGQGPRLLVGSHAESQNHAGWLDGAMGVIYGLEVARAFAEDPACAGLVIEPVAWADEESHYIQLLGSRYFVGELQEADLDAAKEAVTGQSLRDALAGAGLAGRPARRAEPGRWIGYLEAHIEQGDVLDSAGEQIGVVEAIVGIQNYRIDFHGTQNHTGTTRMAIRRDAGRALVDFCHRLNATFEELKAERTVWTVGSIDLTPNAAYIIPGKAEMRFSFRDADPEVLVRLDAALRRLVAEADAAGPCGVELAFLGALPPCDMAAPFRDALAAAAARHAPGRYRRMPSGAIHDAQVIAEIMPAAMLFVPSIGGISHHWTEDTAEADLIIGCQVLADAAQSILEAARG